MNDVAVPLDSHSRSVLGTHSRLAQILLLAFIVGLAFIAFWNLDNYSASWVVALSVAVMTVAAVTLIFVPGDPLPPRATAIAVLAPPIAVAVILGAAPQAIETHDPPWLLGGAVILYVILCLRGRIFVAWAGFAVTLAAAATWATLTAATLPTPSVLLILVSRLLVGTLFALVLRRSIDAIDALRAEEVRRVAARSAAVATREERRERLTDLDQLARPLLTRIAAGEPLSDAERRRCELLEAQLRDRLRAGALTNAMTAGEARAARRRGVDVVMIDDGGLTGAHEVVSGRVRDHVNQALRESTSGRLRIRVLPPGRSKVLSICRIGDSGNTRIDLDADGRSASE